MRINKQINNIINVILIISWILLILNLFSKWFYTTCDSWWIWCIFPTPHYRWTIPWYFALFSSIIMFLLLVSKKINILNKKVYLWKYIIIIWIIANTVNFLLTDEFKMYTTWYIHKKNVNPITYVYLYNENDPYYYNIIDYNNKLIVKDVNTLLNILKDKCIIENINNNIICNWQLILEFQSIDDYIKVLEYSKKNNLSNIYEMTYLSLIYNNTYFDIERLENSIKKYQDTTFQIKLLIEGLYWDQNNYEVADLLIKYSKNRDVVFLAKFYTEKYAEFVTKKDTLNYDEYNNFLNSIIQEVEYKAKNILWVDNNLVKYNHNSIN